MKRFAKAAALSIALLAAHQPAAQAGPFADAAAKAEEAAASDAPGAAGAARAAVAEFVSTLPFAMANAVFLAGPAAGFGMYDAREASFKAGEPLVSYAEVVGLKWVAGGRGFTSAFNVDLELLDAAGEVLGAQKEFGKFTFDSRQPLQEVFTTLTLNADGITAGDYVVRYTFNDVNSGATTTLEQAFKIVE